MIWVHSAKECLLSTNYVLEMVLGTFHILSHLIITRAPGQMLLVSSPLHRRLGTDNKAFGHTGGKRQSWVQAGTRVHPLGLSPTESLR